MTISRFHLCHRRGKRTQHGLVSTAATSDNTDHASGLAVDDLLGAGGQLDSGLALIGVVADNGDVVARSAAQSTTVTNLALNVRNDGTLRNGAQGQNVANGQSSVLSGINKLTSVHSLVGDEGLGVLLELVGVPEDNLGQRSTSAGVVDDLPHNTADVAMSLGVIESSELGRGLSKASVGGYLKSVRTSRFPSATPRSADVIRFALLKMDPRPFLWLRITRP